MSASDPRHPEDWYITPPQCTRALLCVEDVPGSVWEPACGDGAISKVLEDRGCSVFSTDLIDRGYGQGGIDFLATPAGTAVGDAVITNPPYKLADEFVLKSLELGFDYTAMLLRLSWLEGEGRYHRVFSKYPPTRIWVFSPRQTLWTGARANAPTTGGTVAYAWFVWDRRTPLGAAGPVVGWLPKSLVNPEVTA